MRCESGFHFIEPAVRPRKEVPRNGSRIELTVAEPPELQTRHAEVHGHSWCRNPEILGPPVVFGYRVPEPLSDRACRLRVVEIRQEKAKLIAAELSKLDRIKEPHLTRLRRQHAHSVLNPPDSTATISAVS